MKIWQLTLQVCLISQWAGLETTVTPLNRSLTLFQIQLYQANPGLKQNYSDIGMGLLGHILSLRTGVSFDRLVKDRILDVLAMDSTHAYERIRNISS